eukprot:CAMPEP_0185729590 /NCGR_PEP_ID=MMETSP1171-20130828/6466_1 /TAXON_ID=374046 /ORGANISM="Helicotheca tamensis, Strain CCMP826" /LENGTH=227 /DNA_ID=CAMNT_0028398467 /DNA_START=15 /DNA_END=698 /DNA_ORIENTATION=+
MAMKGDVAPDFNLQDSSGKKHKLSGYRGQRILLSFQRYAGCPVCLYNLDRLREQADYLRCRGVVVISIFTSPPDAVARWVESQVKTPFLLLADPKMVCYRAYDTRNSWENTINSKNESRKMMKELKRRGICTSPLRILRCCPKVSPKKFTQVPADYLIDEKGIIFDVHHAENYYDRISWERIDAFIPENMKCKCNRKDCLSDECRANHEEIVKQNLCIFGAAPEDDE